MKEKVQSKRTSLRQAQGKLNVQRSTLNVEFGAASRDCLNRSLRYGRDDPAPNYPAPSSADLLLGAGHGDIRLFRAGQAVGRCEDCEYSVGAGGLSIPMLICQHKAEAEAGWQVVGAGCGCGNFKLALEVVPIEVAEALAAGAKPIPLTQGKFAIVDAADYEELSQYKWCAIKGDSTYYAARRIGKKVVRMHREITGAPKGLVVDHINHDGLDNRKRNLRICTRAENTRNQRLHKRGSSGYKGVSWHKNQKIFHTYIGYKSKKIWLGRFKKAKDAAKAYDKKAIELHGEFACLNFPEEREQK